jgi:hypothetical protein
MLLAPPPSPPTLAPFVGTWIGHTRTLSVRRDGTAVESVGDGCCDPVVDLRLRLTHPRRVHGGLVASVVVTAVRVHDRRALPPGRHAPRIGEKGTLRLRAHVLVESVTGDTYCGPGAKPVCGA